MKKAGLFILIVIVFVTFFYFLNQDRQTLLVGSRKTSDETVSAVIVPHFNTFSEKRLELLGEIFDKTEADTVVLVSVNHFNTGSSNFLTTDKVWSTSEGKMKSDEEMVNQLSASGLVSKDESAFANEHGISNIIPDLIKSKLGKKVVPIIIKDTAPREDIEELVNWILENSKDSLLVASVDFSHYQPNALAKIHDNYSIQALVNNDVEAIWNAETDSPQSLYLAQKIAEKNKVENFNLFFNSNSGELNKNDDAETTSVVLGYYSDKQQENPPAGREPSSSFVIAGDAMFDRNVWQRSKTAGFKSIFDNFGTRVFRGVDAAILNLEGPVSEKPIPGIETGGMSFNFQPEIPSVLKWLGIGAVSLANNHTNNAGASGFISTKKMLDKSGIKYFGLSEAYTEASVLRIEGEVPITIIGIMTLENFDQAALEAKIKAEKATGQFVIIYPHWGTEYAPKHSASQKQMAKEWIAAGADLIVGSHPHVTQDFEIIDGKPVIYSLGNFVFDQFFSEETQQGLILGGTVTKEKITLTFLPTKEKLVKPELMRGAEKTAKLKTVFDIDSESGFTKISSDTIEIIR